MCSSVARRPKNPVVQTRFLRFTAQEERDPMLRRALMMILVLGMGLGNGCSESSNPAAPSNPNQPVTTTPQPPAVQTNRNPTIGSMNVTPGFGVSGVTSFAMTASASDPDGDALIYEWDFGDGTRALGTAFSKIYPGSGVATVRLTVTDGRAGSSTDSRTITVGSMTGQWQGTVTLDAGQTGIASMALTQSGAVVTGAMNLAGFNGRTDPAQPGRIDSAGGVELRMKVDPFSDFTMRGTMDASGRRISGSVFGSGFNGQPFSFDKL
jgi:PKD domain